MRWLSRTCLALVLAVTWTLGAAAGTAMASSPGEESAFLAKMNALRASVGAGPLAPNAALAATACTWNAHIMAADALSHDPALAAHIADAAPDWAKGGENVGMGGDVNTLFDAFVHSPEHYRNLVDPVFTEVGICVDHSADGKLYTTHRFLALRHPATADLVRPKSSAPATPPAATTPPPLHPQGPPAPTGPVPAPVPVPVASPGHVFRF